VEHDQRKAGADVLDEEAVAVGNPDQHAGECTGAGSCGRSRRQQRGR
jgi:hypothetical protein